MDTQRTSDEQGGSIRGTSTHQIPTQHQNCASIICSAAVICCREHSDKLTGGEALESIHHTFVCTDNHLHGATWTVA